MICPTIKFVRKLSADAHSKWHVICPNFSLVGAISGLSRFDIWCVRLSFCMTSILTDQADDFSFHFIINRFLIRFKFYWINNFWFQIVIDLFTFVNMFCYYIINLEILKEVFFSVVVVDPLWVCYLKVAFLSESLLNNIYNYIHIHS